MEEVPLYLQWHFLYQLLEKSALPIMPKAFRYGLKKKPQSFMYKLQNRPKDVSTYFKHPKIAYVA